MLDISTYMAFAAGIVSFLSPCVLPLVPGYISFISGVDLKELNGNASVINRERRMIILNAIFFVTGFSLVFILLGASATWIGAFLTSKMSILMKIAGSVIILFGIFKMGLIRSFFFYREISFQIKDRRFGLAGALIIGAAFAFGWTPCIGPILGSILTFAGTLENVKEGIMLLFIYSLGLGIPFLLTAIGVNRFFGFFERIKKYMRPLEIITGIILVILGLLIFTNKLVLIPGYLTFLNRFSL